MANNEKSGHRNRGKGGQRMKYEEYKDSGVEWIGVVPSYWEVRKIKSLSIVKRGASPRPIEDPKYFDDNGEYAWVRIADVSNSERYLEETTQTLSKLGASLSVKREPGDIFISIAGTVGKPIITHIKCCIHDGFVWFPYLRQNTEFLYYLFMSGQPYLGLGKMGTQLNLNTETIGNIQIPLPPLPEQQTIAAYLDEKCGEINRAIDVQKKKIELLNELKQTIITDAVTKGLNPNAPMKDSGVEWIGKVPSHWEVMRFKDFTSLQTTASDNMNKIGLENIEGKTGRFIESDSEFEGNGIAFNIGDVVYGKLRPYLQKVWIATFSGNAVGDFFVFRPKDNCYNQYLFYCMLSDGFTSMCNGSTVGAKMPRVSSDFIRSLHYYLPPLSEQQTIANYLDEECTKIDVQISNANHRIELLNELKQSIITEAVTGKIKVC